MRLRTKCCKQKEIQEAFGSRHGNIRVGYGWLTANFRLRSSPIWIDLLDRDWVLCEIEPIVVVKFDRYVKCTVYHPRDKQKLDKEEEARIFLEKHDAADRSEHEGSLGHTFHALYLLSCRRAIFPQVTR